MTSTQPDVTAPADALRPFGEYESIDQGCAELGRILNLDAPVAPDVFVSAAEDPIYARNLLTCRNTPAFRDRLLARPPRRWTADLPGDAALLRSAAKSFWTWAKSGMQTVSDEIYRSRLAACESCPHLGKAPGDRALYKLAGTGPICTLCGCKVASKARLATDGCPGRDPSDPTLTRWGEPR